MIECKNIIRNVNLIHRTEIHLGEPKPGTLTTLKIRKQDDKVR